MLRHDDVSQNNETVSPTNPFENFQKKIPPARIIEQWQALVATEGYEMEIASAVEAVRMIRHGRTLRKWGSRCL